MGSARRIRLLLLILPVALTVMNASAWAEASGPDFYRVDGVSPDSGLVLRAAPDRAAPAIGGLPADARGLRNRGCVGGPTLADYTQADVEARAALRETRWCKVAWAGRLGWVAGWYLREGTGPAAAGQDCATLDRPIERRLCADPMLAALDGEVARLYRRAADADPAADRHGLHARHRGWLKGRDDCWKAAAGPARDACIADALAMRLHVLRRDHPQSDASGLSRPRVAYACDDPAPPVSAVFVATEPATLSLHWGDQYVRLTGTRSASGARYAGRDFADRPVIFWIKGDTAQFELSGGVIAVCHVGSAS